MKYTYLECLSEEETLLHIILHWLLQIHILQAAEAVRRSTVSLQRLHGVPAPVTVLLVVRQTPHHEVALEQLRPQNVVFLLRFQSLRLGTLGETVEIDSRLD